MAMDTRTEEDSLGKVQVPKNAYFGAFTARARKNFQISNLTAPDIFRQALGMVKLAAAQTNGELKLLKKPEQKAIEKACEEFISDKFNSEFTLDVFQAGAGTSYNMNANEIIANRANEILGQQKGIYKPLNPNNHINIGQSTNDVIPTATRLATLLSLPELLKQLKNTITTTDKIAKSGQKIIKVGRTHLQDAVPISIGQEFDSYSEALKKSLKFIQDQSLDLQILGIGGTAVGTGLNTHPKYQKLIIKKLGKLSKINFKPGKNLTELANNMNSFLNFSSSLKSLATNLLNFCNDLKIMNMGPKAGLSEITLPEVQEGSSIMPGKVNPSIPECLEMVCLEVIGNDLTIGLAAGKSNFELNVFCPLIMFKILTSMEILTNGLKMFNELCLKNLQINQKRIVELYENSLCTATALSPKLGYKLTAEIVKAALKKGITISEELKNRHL